MTRQFDQGTIPGRYLANTPDEMAKPALDQLVASSRDLYIESTAQLRDIGELAFMELELAIKSLQWGILALLMFGASSIMACMFLMLATVLVLVGSSVSPAAVMLLCGGFSAVAACFLSLGLRSLTTKATFRNLRNHLTRVHDESLPET
jgi:hypothetical protein